MMTNGNIQARSLTIAVLHPGTKAGAMACPPVRDQVHPPVEHLVDQRAVGG